MNPRRKYIHWILVLCLTSGVFVPWLTTEKLVFADERAEANLEVSDVLAIPGKRAQLKAHLFRDGLLANRLGLGGESVEFFIQDRSIGTTMTGGDGKAYLEYVPRLRGNLTIKAQVHDSPRVLDQEATGLLAAWEKRRPILLIDVAALLPFDTKDDPLRSLIPLNLGNDSFPAPDSDAAHELEKLGKFYYNLIYLNRSNSVSVEMVRVWLRKHEFPMGIPMVVKTGPEALIAFLEQLKEDGWENVTAGIGRTLEFAEVLLERRIETVIIQEGENDETFPRRAKIIKGWTTVRRHL